MKLSFSWNGGNRLETICIICPKGCLLKGEKTKEGNLFIKGNACLRGKEYGEREFICPVRILTTTVRTQSGEMLPVKSDRPLKKDSLFIYMNAIKCCQIPLPVYIGDTVLENIDGMGANIVAGKSLGMEGRK